MSTLQRTACYGGVFVVGGAGYGLLEILWRGYTHASMIAIGGLCLVLLMELSKSRHSLLVLCVAGGGCITGVEFAAGCVVNLWMGLGVWDYSEEALHLWGQICPRFFLLWCLLCAGVLPVCRRARVWAASRLVRRRAPGRLSAS